MKIEKIQHEIESANPRRKSRPMLLTLRSPGTGSKDYAYLTICGVIITNITWCTILLTSRQKLMRCSG